MIAHKHITGIVAAITAAAICLCLAAMMFSDELVAAASGTGVTMEYESKLFDTDEVISVNILMDSADWSEMLENATSETYYSCDVEINGETFYRVGIRTKGNTSLTSIASDPDTQRYSFKLEFDKYVDGQTCYGLDKLVLNNNYADATNMKEALIYDMYRYLGADASLYNYASISVNGEYWGVYLALEAVEDSFLLRNYGVNSGELYKPESMDMGGEDGGNGGFSMSGSGADLNYTDDDPDSYSTIWEGEVTSTDDADHLRVIEALKNISEGTDLESYMDVDNLLKYAAVHIFSVNEDSLSGRMAHNYYLYEKDGQLNLIPWDYNLALGGMSGGSDATSVVNEAIDDAFSGTNFFDALLADETYHAQYDAYLQALVDEYLLGDGFETFYTRTRSLIDSLVETDPTAFYTYDEYVTAAETLYEVVKRRGESIDGQLDGTIPSTAAGQVGSDALIDASDLSLNAMGSMNAGGGQVGFGGGFDGGTAFAQGGNPPDIPEGVGGVPPSQDAEATETAETAGETTDDAANTAPERPEGTMPPQTLTTDGTTDTTDAEASEAPELPEGTTAPTDGDATESIPTDVSADAGFPPSGNGQAPFDFDAGNIPGDFSQTDSGSVLRDNLILYGVCLAILIAALLFAKFFPRRH